MIKIADTKVFPSGAFRCCVRSLDDQLLTKGLDNFVSHGHSVRSKCGCQTEFRLGKDNRWVAVRENVLLESKK